MEGGRGMERWAVPLPNPSLCDFRPLPHPLLFTAPPSADASLTCLLAWVSSFLPPRMSHWAPHFFVSHCLLLPAWLSLSLSQICSHVIHLSSPLFAVLASAASCWAVGQDEAAPDHILITWELHKLGNNNRWILIFWYVTYDRQICFKPQKQRLKDSIKLHMYRCI